MGCPMNEKLAAFWMDECQYKVFENDWQRVNEPNQEACTPVICRVSSGFSCLLSPVNAGMTIVGNASTKPIFHIKRFFALPAKNWSTMENMDKYSTDYSLGRKYLRQYPSKWRHSIRRTRSLCIRTSNSNILHTQLIDTLFHWNWWFRKFSSINLEYLQPSIINY